ncbi:hypothetical protein SKAU_G00183000 [Synaphobranchus kaupii]|uniref:Uncharacterized protein n=1 Tax=Synaphobranchus kaupii TaxID=118154 RepID=A0A9Q1FC91_SYNKA|nr:hypothetical protein SKAU_G00183000 [Synaphobranchus kaupii]
MNYPAAPLLHVLLAVPQDPSLKREKSPRSGLRGKRSVYPHHVPGDPEPSAEGASAAVLLGDDVRVR